MAVDKIVASGLARSCPAISGAEPCTGSYRPLPDEASDADGNMPREPVNIAATSERMSPNMLPVFDHLVRSLVVDPTGLLQCPHGLAGAALAQFGIAAAGDQLLRLDEKFNVSDAAAADLDVVPFDGDGVVAAVAVDLALDGVHVFDRREIQVTAPDERL